MDRVLGPLLIIAFGVGAIAFCLVQVQNARKNGLSGATGGWYPPTDRVVKKYIVATLIGGFAFGAVVVALGVWLLLSPQSLLVGTSD